MNPKTALKRTLEPIRVFFYRLLMPAEIKLRIDSIKVLLQLVPQLPFLMNFVASFADTARELKREQDRLTKELAAVQAKLDALQKVIDSSVGR